MIPRHYMAQNATKRLKGYVEVYLNEEIREEGEVRELEAFERFMEVAAISDGEMLNYSNIASDCGVSAKTVQSYFQILYDTLIGYEIPAYRKAVIGDDKVAIEIKSVELVKPRHKAGLKAFKEEHPDCRLIMVSLDPVPRKVEDIELIPVLDFLRMLWNGEIF